MKTVAPTADAAYCAQTFADTLALLERTRDLLAAGTGSDAIGDVAPAVRMRVARDMSRLTSRASAAMSVMLLYKAVAEEDGGGIENPAAQLEDLYGEVVRGAAAAPGEPDLPQPVADLMAEAERVFERTARVYEYLRARLDG